MSTSVLKEPRPKAARRPASEPSLETPRVDLPTFARLTDNSQGPTLFGYATRNSLKQVMAPGYFDLAGPQLERHDRIIVTALAGDARDIDKSEHATLLVIEGRTARQRGAPVTVTLLREAGQ